jgi:CO/xanthine dehydrogenase FAD-binding subunit
MIIEYLRPKTIPEALALLARKRPVSFPLGGGTYLNQKSEDQYAVIDLQDLELDAITRQGNILQVGATTTLQALADYQGLPEAVYKTINHEATYNLRNMATIAGTLVTSNGRSPFTTLMLALDLNLELLESEKNPVQVRLGNWLPVRILGKPNKLISMVSFPFDVKITYESVSRSPADQPIVCAAMVQWPSGRTRLALGGWGKEPILAMDGPEAQGVEVAARNAYHQAEDEWASAEYRGDIAEVLALRCMEQIDTE